MAPKGDIAVIGLAVMGQNLILNMASNGFYVVAFNRTVQTVDTFLKGPAKGAKVIGAKTLHEMVSNLKTPRKVMLMIKAGEPVDDQIKQLIPLLSEGDVIIDGGNSDYEDTDRRYKELKKRNIYYVGCGVSGGEEGARYGPSLMPGGHADAWPIVQPIFEAIAAKVNDEPCCSWVGEGGAGHFVKMVHNGIEYGDMQLICETYHIMRSLKMNNEEMSAVFEKWNKEELDSYLIEITANILKYKDEKGYLVDRISDKAGQKGTGKLTVISGMKYGVPCTTIAESVFARLLAAAQADRQQASQNLTFGSGTEPKVENLQEFLDQLKQALYCAKIISYAQGLMLLRTAGYKNHWNLNYGEIALMWRGGCIIRSVFLGEIKAAFDKEARLSTILLDEFFKDKLQKGQQPWRQVVSKAIQWGVPVPAFASALTFWDGYRTPQLPANLLQAQRDYFGAHTYELRGEVGKWYHTDWTGEGGNVSASTYQV